jgi:hypothetical protein
MNQTLTRTDVDLDTLTLIMNAEPLKCESETHIGGDTTCSHDVAYLLSVDCTRQDLRVCTNVGELANVYIADGDYECAHCDRDMEICWSVRPI